MGRIVYTQMLNARGGIEADLTVTRLSETAFLLVVPGATLQRDLAWLRRHIGRRLRRRHRRDGGARRCSCVMGPRSRDLLRAVSPDDLSNEAFPFGTAREIEIGLGLARAHRVTYVGELGWELYVSADQAAARLRGAGGRPGREVGLRLCGLHALDSLPDREGLPPLGP